MSFRPQKPHTGNLADQYLLACPGHKSTRNSPKLGYEATGSFLTISSTFWSAGSLCSSPSSTHQITLELDSPNCGFEPFQTPNSTWSLPTLGELQVPLCVFGLPDRRTCSPASAYGCAFAPIWPCPRPCPSLTASQLHALISAFRISSDASGNSTTKN